jgi:hypothetical protein
MVNQTIMPVKPVATVNAGGVWESINGGLSNALDLWAKVEQIKGQKSASGQDQVQAMYKPELENGAAVQMDKQLTTKKNSGFKFDKRLMYASLGLLGLAFILRMKGFK